MRREFPRRSFTYVSHNGYPSTQADRSNGNLVHCLDRSGKCHRYTDFSHRRYRLERARAVYIRRAGDTLTLFTILSFESCWTLACVRTRAGAHTDSTISTGLTTASILIFTSLPAEPWWTLTGETTEPIRRTLCTIQTRIRCASISYIISASTSLSSIDLLLVSQRGPLKPDGQIH